MKWFFKKREEVLHETSSFNWGEELKKSMAASHARKLAIFAAEEAERARLCIDCKFHAEEDNNPKDHICNRPIRSRVDGKDYPCGDDCQFQRAHEISDTCGERARFFQPKDANPT